MSFLKYLSESVVIPLNLENRLATVGVTVSSVVENKINSHFRFLKLRKVDDRGNLEWAIYYQSNGDRGYFFDREVIEAEIDDEVNDTIKNFPKKILGKSELIVALEDLYSVLTQDN